jgi:hypothetical protein
LVIEYVWKFAGLLKVCFVAPYRMHKGVVAKLNELAAGPPPTEFKLTVSPGYHVRSDDPNSAFVNLSLYNDSMPPAELNNIVGEFRTDERFILWASTRPARRIRTKAGRAVFVYYNFSLRMLHKSMSTPIVEWKFRTPSEGEFIPIGIDVVSSDTSQQRINWRVVRDGERVRIIPAPLTRAR